jgi:hypothetical protein
MALTKTTDPLVWIDCEVGSFPFLDPKFKTETVPALTPEANDKAPLPCSSDLCPKRDDSDENGPMCMTANLWLFDHDHHPPDVGSIHPLPAGLPWVDFNFPSLDP